MKLLKNGLCINCKPQKTARPDLAVT